MIHKTSGKPHYKVEDYILKKLNLKFLTSNFHSSLISFKNDNHALLYQSTISRLSIYTFIETIKVFDLVCIALITCEDIKIIMVAYMQSIAKKYKEFDEKKFYQENLLLI